MKLSTKIGALLATLLVLGCENSLVVQGSFPSPMVEKIPHTIGVHYEPAFSAYQYVEEAKDRSKWTINTGQAQTSMLNTILPQMFEQVVKLGALPDSENPSKTDLVFSPRVEEFQYAMPRETKVNVFEIWVKYNMRVYTGDGQLLADWLMTAYGKTPTAFMKSREDAINEAVVIALRDLGASLSLRFQHVPEIKAWLEDHQQATLSQNGESNAS